MEKIKEEKKNQSKNKSMFKKAYRNKREKLSLFGLNPTKDWLVILSLSFLLLIIISFYSFNFYIKIDNQLSDFRQPETFRTVDRDDLQKVLDEINKTQVNGGNASDVDIIEMATPTGNSENVDNLEEENVDSVDEGQ